MRLNKYIALATGMSRRAADDAIAKGRVVISDKPAELGQQVDPEKDIVSLDGKRLDAPEKPAIIMLNKPIGYVCSRDGQGSKTIYNLLPDEYHALKPVGRLDKDSSGLLLLTNDGTLAYKLTHPSFQKEKIYEVKLDKPLASADKAKIEKGIMLDDGRSSLQLTVDSKQQETDSRQLSAVNYLVRMHEGRNRQIRRTFEALGYKTIMLHRTRFGPYSLKDLGEAKYKPITDIILDSE